MVESRPQAAEPWNDDFNYVAVISCVFSLFKLFFPFSFFWFSVCGFLSQLCKLFCFSSVGIRENTIHAPERIHRIHSVDASFIFPKLFQSGCVYS